MNERDAQDRMDQAACRECLYWEQTDPALGGEGECRERSPRVKMVNAETPHAVMVPLWPTTLGEQWCGRFDR